MTDPHLDTLKHVPVPPARDTAKAKALAAAMTAFEAASVAPRVSPGPRPFMLRHGYKIAASLAAICVIGPLLLSLPTRRESVPDETSMRSRTAATLPEAPPAQPEITPPLVRTKPLAASPALPPAAQAPAPVPPPAANKDITYYGLDNTNSSTRFGYSGAPAKAPEGPKLKTVETPKSAPEAAPATRTSAPTTSWPIPTLFNPTALDELRAEIDAGRVPATINALDLINAFADDPRPTAPTSPAEPLVVAVSLVAAPWRPSRKLAHIQFSGTPPLAPLLGTANIKVMSAGVADFRPPVPVAPTKPPSPEPDRRSGLAMQRTRTVLLDLLPVDPPVPGQWLAMVSFSLGNLTKGRTGSKVIPITLDRELPSLAAAPIDVRFAIAVARFADLLTGVADNPATFGYDETIALAEGARGPDPSGERTAFVALMRKAQALRR